MSVEATVAPVGQGFFIEGNVRMRCVVECECCGVAHVGEAVEAPMRIWLDAAASEPDASGEWDIVPFPRNAEECDLTWGGQGLRPAGGAVRDAVLRVRRRRRRRGRAVHVPPGAGEDCLLLCMRSAYLSNCLS